MDKPTIYPYPITYARENGELEQYRASLKALVECKCAIVFSFFDYLVWIFFGYNSANFFFNHFDQDLV